MRHRYDFCYNLPMFDTDNILRFAKEVIDIETQAVSALKERLDQNFAQACAIILQAKGKVVVSGMGKSGHIARKIAATLASTGTPSFSCIRQRQAMVIWARWLATTLFLCFLTPVNRKSF